MKTRSAGGAFGRRMLLTGGTAFGGVVLIGEPPAFVSPHSPMLWGQPTITGAPASVSNPRARLTNLHPGTDYVYAASHNGAAAEFGTVRTAPHPRAPFTSTSFGDQGTPTLAKDFPPSGKPCCIAPSRALVELLRRYSNRDDLLKSLVSVLERVNEESPAGHEEAQLTSADGPTPRAWQISRRLTPADIKTLVTSYLAGSTIKVLAEQYTISTTSVKRLLREHGARKQRPRNAA